MNYSVTFSEMSTKIPHIGVPLAERYNIYYIPTEILTEYRDKFPK